MKKIYLFAALIAGFTFYSCSSDENHVPVPTYSDCQICDIVDQPELNSYDYEVCVGTIQDVNYAYVAGGNTGITPEDYFNLYCQNDYTSTGTGTGTGTGTAGTPTTDCVTCAAIGNYPQTSVCKGTNGNAFLGDADSTIPYDTYISNYQTLTGSTCQ